MTAKPRKHKKGQRAVEQHGSKGLLSKDEVRKIIRVVAEKMGVLDEFNDIVSGKKETRDLLDGVDLEKAKNEAKSTFVNIKRKEDKYEEANASCRTDRDVVFDTRESRFVKDKCGDDNVPGRPEICESTKRVHEDHQHVSEKSTQVISHQEVEPADYKFFDESGNEIRD